VTNLSVRAAGYGMPGVSVDGMHLLAVHTAAVTAVQRARSGEGPSLIEARAYRFMPNTSNDDDTRYRSREEVEEWRKRDPIAQLRAHLVASAGITGSRLTTLEQEVAEEVAEAAAWAEAEPEAQPEEALLHTWAEGPVAALEWMRG
jgi:2-oxoisovalerate dehydrogenase E1 component alpha subunit